MTTKILHILPSLSPLRGGPSFSVPAMAQGQVQAGLDVHIATTDDDGTGHLHVPLAVPVQQKNVTCWYFRRQVRFYTISWPLTHWLSRHIGDYDLVHIHALFSYPSLPAALFAARRRIPYMVRPLGTLNRWGMQNRRPWFKQISFQLVERYILAHAATVHFTSEQERQEAAESGVQRASVVIPLGIDLAEFAHPPAKGHFRDRYPELHGKLLILFLSRLDQKKGLDLLLPAFAHLCQQRSDVILILAGNASPAYATWLRQQVQALGIMQQVVFAGFLAGEQKIAALQDCDYFVLPSYSENFGVVVVEAMASGLPVLISDQVGIWREVTAAGAGFVVPCQIEALTRGLFGLAVNADLRHAMGSCGRELVQARYSLEASTRQLLQVYRQFL